MIIPYGMLNEAVNLAKLLKYINEPTHNVNANVDKEKYHDMANSLLKSLGGDGNNDYNNDELQNEDLRPYGVTTNEIQDACKALLTIASETNEKTNKDTFKKFNQEYGVYGRFNERELAKLFKRYIDCRENEARKSGDEKENDKLLDADGQARVALKKLQQRIEDSKNDWRKAGVLDETLLELFNFKDSDIANTWRKTMPKFQELLDEAIKELEEKSKQNLARDEHSEQKNQKDNSRKPDAPK